MVQFSEFEAVARLALACFLAGVVGYERQSRNKAAGLRTHILVALGACLIMILSISVHVSVNGPAGGDATRLAAQVISGIGFLGAGSIMASKQGLTVTGLTTAASLWVVAAIGLAIGAGYYLYGAATTVFVFITLTGIGRLEIWMKKDKCTLSLVALSIDRPGQIGRIGTTLGDAGIGILDIKMSTENCDKDHLEIFLCLNLPRQAHHAAVINMLKQIDGIISVHENDNSGQGPY